MLRFVECVAVIATPHTTYTYQNVQNQENCECGVIGTLFSIALECSKHKDNINFLLETLKCSPREVVEVEEKEEEDFLYYILSSDKVATLSTFLINFYIRLKFCTGYENRESSKQLLDLY